MGLTFSVITTISWIYTLRYIPLNFAYPFFSLAYPLVLICSFFIYGEDLTVGKIVGTVIILMGLVIISKY
ncbi:EamA family transporter [Paenibacillus turpanensis]|uniref:EamA family transporter n=1 Tax=Paenibacillus turpanensis TaxID=2689078 RepID=UPI003C7C4009